jgi:hypothetical protein
MRLSTRFAATGITILCLSAGVVHAGGTTGGTSGSTNGNNKVTAPAGRRSSHGATLASKERQAPKGSSHPADKKGGH